MKKYIVIKSVIHKRKILRVDEELELSKAEGDSLVKAGYLADPEELAKAKAEAEKQAKAEAEAKAKADAEAKKKAEAEQKAAAAQGKPQTT